MNNKEKFLALVSEKETNTAERNKERIRNRVMLRESQGIAIKVLKKLDELGWSQKLLAEKLGVSPQQVNKIVKGGENLTIETLIRLQNILEIPILASFYDLEKGKQKIVSEMRFTESIEISPFFAFDKYTNSTESRRITSDYDDCQQQLA